MSGYKFNPFTGNFDQVPRSSGASGDPNFSYKIVDTDLTIALDQQMIVKNAIKISSGTLTVKGSLVVFDNIQSSSASSTSWIDVAGDVEYTGVEAAIASGSVLTCSYQSGTIYRFINSTNNANGYPTEDSFYSNFDGTSLTNLIVTRGG